LLGRSEKYHQNGCADWMCTKIMFMQVK